MKRTEKVAVSIPRATLRALERARRRLGQSRSAVVSEALNDWLRARDQGDADRRYSEGYLRRPERGDDTAAVAAAVAETWEPWE